MSATDPSSAPPPVAAVLVNFRTAPLTRQAVRSVLQLQTPPAWVVVVDNDSGDGSANQLRRACPEAVVIESGHNGGFGYGCNIGIQWALDRGAAYVWLINSDAQAQPGALAALLQTAEADPHVGLVGSVVCDPHGRVQSWGGGRASRWTGHARAATAPQQPRNFLTGASLLLKRELITQTRGFDERFFFLWEDVDLCWRAAALGWRMAVAEESKISHLGGGSEGHTPRRMAYHAAGLVHFMRRHSPLPLLTSLPLLGYYAILGLRQPRLFTAALTAWLHAWRAPRTFRSGIGPTSQQQT